MLSGRARSPVERPLFLVIAPALGDVCALTVHRRPAVCHPTVLQIQRPFWRIALKLLGSFVAEDFRNHASGIDLVKLIVADFRTVRQPPHSGN